MSVLGVINSDPQIRKAVETAFQTAKHLDFELSFLSEDEEILEFLNYELPEIVVINFSDPRVNIQTVVDHISNDTWLLNFGIVGLFNQESDDEESLLTRLKDINVLTLLDQSRIRTHIVKNIQIIEENYQIIFQREFTKNLLEGASGSFQIENDILAVPLYAGIGATILAQRGCINPDSKMHLQLALAELIVNAVEHGNCGISYQEKTDGMDEGLSVVELVAEKCRQPEIAARRVDFQWEIQKDRSLFIIRDEGEGFDVAAHLEIVKNQSEMSLHGRGIRMANMLANELKYNDKGNEVTLVIHHDPSVQTGIPAGFSREQVLMVKKNDIIFREGESSDYLYYISNGKFSIFHNRKLVGLLAPRDIFLGEMSFLLNKKRSATVRAETPGKLVRLSRKTFVNVIREYPHYGIFLSKLLAKRLVRSNARNASLARKLGV